MSQAREVRQKIGSIKSTQKITRAMELVAASKMRKAQLRMSRSKPYSEKIREMICHVASSRSESRHPYLLPREKLTRVGYIVVTTDRGLCGGLNINLFRKLLQDMQKWQAKEVAVDLCTIGHKAATFFNRYGGDVIASSSHLGEEPAVADLIGLIKVMLDKYDASEIDRVFIAGNDFVNTMLQKPFIRQLLPLESFEADDTQAETEKHWDYIYEPDTAREMLEALMVRYIESQVYQAVVENGACEQSARMVAMKSATENASDLIKELQLIYNKARQASITSEIAEIVGGAAAIDG